MPGTSQRQGRISSISAMAASSDRRTGIAAVMSESSSRRTFEIALGEASVSFHHCASVCFRRLL